MVEEIEEKWIRIPRQIQATKNSIEAISNTGKLRRFNLSVEPIPYRKKINIEGRHPRCYVFIAEHFLITVRRPDQTCIDHVTHSPEGMNINDVRNLRWCTHRENCSFEEARRHISEGKKGKPNLKIRLTGHGNWKGDEAGKGAKRKRKQRYGSEKPEDVPMPQHGSMPTQI